MRKEHTAFDSRRQRKHDKRQLGLSLRETPPTGTGYHAHHANDGFAPGNSSLHHENSLHHDSEFDDDQLSPNDPSLAGKVLILNGNYEPLAICNVQKAIILLYLHKAELVSGARDRAVRSTSSSMPFPSVIRLSNFVRVPFKKVILSRKNILRRDGHRCQYCGSASVSLTVDHIMPRSRGGEDSWENLVSACLRCNNRKGSHTPDEAQMPLLKRPIRPNHVTFLRQYAGKIGKDWEPYLFM